MSVSRRQPPKVPRPTPIQRATSPTIAALAVNPTATALAAFWSAHAFPLVEPAPPGSPPGTVLVTFCRRDPDAAEVLLFANRLTDETRLDDSLLERVEGTDLWHVGFVLEADWRASYSFLVRHHGERAPWLADGDQVALRAALDRGERDPLNPTTSRNRAGVVQSVVSLPDAPAQPWLAPRAGVPRGELERATGPLGRDLWRYTAADAALDAPLLLVLDGEVWVTDDILPTTLDNLVADGVVPPLRAVFLASGGRDARWAEMGAADGQDATASYVIDQLLPALASDGLLPSDPARVLVAGQSLGGLTALRLALRHPDRIGIALSQSASLWLDDLAPEVEETTGAALRPRVDLAHGRQEWVLAPPHHELAARLGAAGVPLTTRTYNGGHDYAWWRGALADGLAEALAASPRPATSSDLLC